MFWFIVLLLLAGAGFYFYQKMMAIEREIREEQESDLPVAAPIKETGAAKDMVDDPAAENVSDPPVVTPEVEKMAAKAEPVADKDMSLVDEILEAVKNLPGMKQTDLYSSFADVSKKQLQQLLKELDDAGTIKREKKGNSYLLYPVED